MPLLVLGLACLAQKRWRRALEPPARRCASALEAPHRRRIGDASLVGVRAASGKPAAVRARKLSRLASGSGALVVYQQLRAERIRVRGGGDQELRVGVGGLLGQILGGLRSTISPAYMTRISSAKYRAEAMSWVM